MAQYAEDVIARLDPAEHRKVEDMAAKPINEKTTLRELRKARALTPVSVAREFGISQDAIFRLEKRSDLLLSTLRNTVEATGGSLSLIVRFPDRPPVEHAGAECRMRPEIDNYAESVTVRCLWKGTRLAVKGFSLQV